MTFDEYQKKALRTARDPREKDEFFHLVLGLVGESAEVAEKVKKWIRDQDSDMTKLNLEDIKKELGDVLWYIAVLAEFLDLSIDDIAKLNIEKLASRNRRGTLNGSGDNR